MTASLHTWVSSHVASALGDFLTQQRTTLNEHAPELGNFVDQLEGFLVGGKFLRPRFVAVGALAVGAENLRGREQSLARLGAAVELVQAAALIHDDLIDHSHTRRGRPSIHVAAAKAHQRWKLSGSAEDFGAATAVVLGDLALSFSEQLASTALSGPRDRAQFDALRTEVMAGQYLDILNQADGLSSFPDTESAAMAVIRWKTVPYTVMRPLLLGATHAGASEEMCAALEEFSVPLGTAFQLRDDLLGVFGDESRTGKPASGDITEGKRTVLLAHAWQHARDTQRDVLRDAVGLAQASPDHVAAARDVLVQTGARAHVQRLVREHATHSREILDGPLRALATEEACDALDALITQATGVSRS